MKKNEKPHSLLVNISSGSGIIGGKCSCVAGAGGFCHHVIALLYYLAHCKQLGLVALPDDLTCTMMPQRWSVPRGKNITPQPVDNVMVKKPAEGADYTKFIKSTLYSPSDHYPLLGPREKQKLQSLNPEPLLLSTLPEDMDEIECTPTGFGNVPKGSVLSYQQKLGSDYVINDLGHTEFPPLPLVEAGDRFQNNISLCLTSSQDITYKSLDVSQEKAYNVEQNTRGQSDNQLWYFMRSKRVTASKFGVVAKRLSNFESLVKQLQPSKYVQTAAMKRGIDMEGTAALTYSKAKQNEVNLYPSGLVINPKCPWLGCSPDRKVYDSSVEGDISPYGLLEVKVVQEGVTKFDKVSYLQLDKQTNTFTLKENHDYHYQVQCQLGITGLEWCDFFSYIDNNTYFCQRIQFDPSFFQKAKDKADLFYFNYFI